MKKILFILFIFILGCKPKKIEEFHVNVTAEILYEDNVLDTIIIPFYYKSTDIMPSPYIDLDGNGCVIYGDNNILFTTTNRGACNVKKYKLLYTIINKNDTINYEK